METKNVIKYVAIALMGIAMFVFLARFLKGASISELNSVQVILTAKVLEDDVFQLFYWEEEEPKFRIEKSVRTQVKGSPEFQEISFEIPEIKKLYKLRLDIGENDAQGAVTIKSLKFKDVDRAYDFDADRFNRLFAPNLYIRATGKHRFLGIQGQKGSKMFYDPYFISIAGSEEFELLKSNSLTDFPYSIAAFASVIFILFLFFNLNILQFTPKFAFVTIFMLILILPTLQHQMGFTKELDNLEKRELTKMPNFAWSKSFALTFEEYYDDHFGLRNNLVDWGAAYKTQIFRSSKNPDLVMFGKDKWLFYNRRVGNSRMFNSYSRTNLLMPDSLALLVKSWEHRKRKYELDNRKYYLVFWPNKHSIYPEFISSIMKKQIKDTLSRVDQILNYLRITDSKVSLTDVRPKLLQEKKKHQLYHKFDSHWNDYGAFIGYSDFMAKNSASMGVFPKPLHDFDVAWEDYYGGELIQLLGFRNNGFFREQRPIFTLKNGTDQIENLSVEGFPRLTVRTRNNNAGNHLKVLIFRDSFTNSLEQFLSLNFYEVTYIWQNHNEYYVNKLDPDIIIDGYVEREIGNKIQ